MPEYSIFVSRLTVIMMDKAQMSDFQHRIAVSDDQQAFLALHAHFQPLLQKFAYSICRNQQDAEEIVEDVFVRIWVKRKTLDQIHNLKLYLYLATRNFSLNYIRNRHGIQQFDIEAMQVELQDLEPDPQERMVHAEMKNQLREAVNELPLKCKIIFKLVKEDGLKQKEVAELLHLNLKTVENQLAIAIKKLIQTIGKYKESTTGKPVSDLTFIHPINKS